MQGWNDASIVLGGVMQPPKAPPYTGYASMHESMGIVSPDYGGGVVFLQSLPASLEIDSSSLALAPLITQLIYESRLVLAKKIADHLLERGYIDYRIVPALLHVYTIYGDESTSASLFEHVKYRMGSKQAYVLMIQMYVKSGNLQKAFDTCMAYRALFSRQYTLEYIVLKAYVRDASMKECLGVVRAFGGRFGLYYVIYERACEMNSGLQRAGVMSQSMKRFIKLLKREAWLDEGLDAVLYYHARREEWVDVEICYLEMVRVGVEVGEVFRGIFEKVVGRGQGGLELSREEREMIERIGRVDEEVFTKKI
jgi:hypothetical protein